jgi:hypothetical protein
MNYIIATIDNPFDYDTMQEWTLYSLQQERQEVIEADVKEEGEKETSRD